MTNYTLKTPWKKRLWRTLAESELIWKSALARKLLWRYIAQQEEFKFHRLCARRTEEIFTKEASSIFTHFGYRPDQFVGKTLLDVGAGSQLLTRFFTGTRIIAVEPLANRFMASLDWCELKNAFKVYALPAERRITELLSTVDFAVSINVLDHCYDPATVIRNIFDYLNITGEACVSFDCRTHRDRAHHRLLTETAVKEMARKAGFTIVRTIHGTGDIYPDKIGFAGDGTTTLIMVKKGVA